MVLDIDLYLKNKNFGLKNKTLQDFPYGNVNSFLVIIAHWLHNEYWLMMKRTNTIKLLDYPYIRMNLRKIILDLFVEYKLDNSIFNFN